MNKNGVKHSPKLPFRILGLSSFLKGNPSSYRLMGWLPNQLAAHCFPWSHNVLLPRRGSESHFNEGFEESNLVYPKPSAISPEEWRREGCECCSFQLYWRAAIDAATIGICSLNAGISKTSLWEEGVRKSLADGVFFAASRWQSVLFPPQFPLPSLILAPVGVCIHASSCTGYQICAFQCWVQIMKSKCRLWTSVQTWSELPGAEVRRSSQVRAARGLGRKLE